MRLKIDAVSKQLSFVLSFFLRNLTFQFRLRIASRMIRPISERPRYNYPLTNADYDIFCSNPRLIKRSIFYNAKMHHLIFETKFITPLPAFRKALKSYLIQNLMCSWLYFYFILHISQTVLLVYNIIFYVAVFFMCVHSYVHFVLYTYRYTCISLFPFLFFFVRFIISIF